MFSWDPNKAILNYEKHRVSFEEGATIFDDEDALDFEDREHSGSEERRVRIGASMDERVLVVVYTIRRTADEKETIRIISARPSSRKEREKYSRQ